MGPRTYVYYSFTQKIGVALDPVGRPPWTRQQPTTWNYKEVQC